MVVVSPPFSISTAEAYRLLAPHLTAERWDDKMVRFCSRLCAETARDDGCALENDFERVIFQKRPELGELKERLQAAGARPALLCGSGAAMFGLCNGRRQAVRVRDSLDLAGGGCFVVHTVTRVACEARWRRWLRVES
jgi:4-diphosphocytidyl-2-C-methyl-D-erythritol kinase